MSPVLHVGVVIDTHTPEKWVVDLIQRLQAEPRLSLTVGVRPVSPLPRATLGPAARIANYLLHGVIDKPLFTHDPMAATALPDATNAISLVDHKDRFEICDIIVLLSPHSLESTHQTLLDIGVWHADLTSLANDIEHALLSRSPFIWLELYKASAPDSDGSHTLKNLPISRHALPCQTFSLSDLYRLAYSSLPAFFLSRLIWLAESMDAPNRDDASIFNAASVFPNEKPTTKTDHQQLQVESGGLTYLMLVIRLLWRQSKQRIHTRFYQEHWQLAISRQASSEDSSINAIASTPIATYKSICETSDVMWADPHLCEYSGCVYVFYEQKKQHSDNGQIMFAKLDEDGAMVDNGIALTTDYHLSYPFVFTHNNQHYMVPETASLKAVSLFRATDFPLHWEPVGELLSGIDAADSTLYHYNGHWWMFTNCQSHRCVDERDELHLYYSVEIEGPWTPHPLNPVLTGVDRARMAGPIFEQDGQLYRVSQYGAYRYGYGINISRIDELSTKGYKEEAYRQITPSGADQWLGCHSFGRLRGLRVIDRVRFSRR